MPNTVQFQITDIKSGSVPCHIRHYPKYWQPISQWSGPHWPPSRKQQCNDVGRHSIVFPLQLKWMTLGSFLLQILCSPIPWMDVSRNWDTHGVIPTYIVSALLYLSFLHPVIFFVEPFYYCLYNYCSHKFTCEVVLGVLHVIDSIFFKSVCLWKQVCAYYSVSLWFL